MYIVYRTVNLTDGKFYIGVHKTDTEEFDGYLGSGLRLKRAVKKHGKKNFKRLTLSVYTCPEKAYEKERELLETWLSHENCYNIAEGGNGGYTQYTPERSRKIGRAHKGKEVSNQTRERIRKSKIGVYKFDKNPRAKSWKVFDPDGNLFTITGRLQYFCESHDLIFSTLYNNKGKRVPPIRPGRYGGFREKYPGHRQKRKNTTGWKLIGG